MDTMNPDTEGPDDAEEAVTFHYSPKEGDQPMLAVLEAVSWIKGVDVMDLEPLSHVIDPDALNRQIGGNDAPGEFYRSRTVESADPEVSFHYEGCRVIVSGERITVREERRR